MSGPRTLFVTGKLAEPALRRQLTEIAAQTSLDYEVAVLPISVVALATTEWIARHLRLDADFGRVILPGLCPGDLDVFAPVAPIKVERGPKDFRDLPECFGKEKRETPSDYGKFDIEILAEINSAHRLSTIEILKQAKELHSAGADVIDLGCDPGSSWTGVGETVHALRGEGLRVSIDSFDPVEVASAVRAGAELVLSVNSSNVHAAKDWGCEVVVIPDSMDDLSSLDRNIESLAAAGVPFRVDPILSPIGHGFGRSLARYFDVRRRYPQIAMMMGVGNLTELTDVDSAGINVLLLALCQEFQIRSVLTTQVINWCRSAVREIDLARRLVYHACTRHTVPKHVEPGLVCLRDPKLREHGAESLTELANRISDRNFRIFAERGSLHAMNSQMHLCGTDPFELFEQMSRDNAIDPAHAFYLGFEMAKAATALALGKNYTQDQALRWGFLTVEEASHRNKMKVDQSQS